MLDEIAGPMGPEGFGGPEKVDSLEKICFSLAVLAQKEIYPPAAFYRSEGVVPEIFQME